jgi:hypothetical protein
MICHWYLKQNYGDAAVSSSQVVIAFEGGLRLKQLPAFVVRFGPVFAEDARADFILGGEFMHALLNSDANVASGAGGAVAVDDLQCRLVLLACEGEFTVEALQRLGDLRHIGF